MKHTEETLNLYHFLVETLYTYGEDPCEGIHLSKGLVGTANLRMMVTLPALHTAVFDAMPYGVYRYNPGRWVAQLRRAVNHLAQISHAEAGPKFVPVDDSALFGGTL